jgi:hypothetical protein
LIESDSLVGTKCANALSGTGVDSMVLPLLLDPPPDELLVELERVVPPADVFALAAAPALELVPDSTVVLVPDVEFEDSAEVEFTLVVAAMVRVLPADSAEAEPAAEETPLACDAVSNDAVAAPPPVPAPDDDPAVFDAVAATVPAVVD